MPRYFLTTNAARPVQAGGRSFIFEPVGLRGGSWLGVLAVDDSDVDAANILASGENTSVGEINADRFDFLKKKLTETRSGLPVLPRQSGLNQGAAHAIAGPAGLPTAPTSANGSTVFNSTESITAVTVLTTDRQPPPEPLLQGPATKRRRY